MSTPRWAILLSIPILTTQALAQERLLVDEVRATFDSAGANDHGGILKVDPPPPDPIVPPIGGTRAGGVTQPIIGGPPNDDCADAAIIPGNAVDYSTGLFTAFATTEGCEGQESCALFNIGWNVWYEYTPTNDGRIEVDTLGSNYDTVLSIFTSCGFQSGIFCFQPSSIVCNDDYFFGTTSLVTLEVEAGTTYRIKIAGKNGGGSLALNFRYYPSNDVCANATEIIGTAFGPDLLSTHNADAEPCEAEEDCEFNNVGVGRTVWYSFLAPCDGLINLNTNGSNYDTVLSVFDGCGIFNGVDNPCGVPDLIACDDDSGTGLQSQLSAVPVLAGTEYFIKASAYGLSSGGGWLDFNFFFEGASPPQAEITSPTNFECICDSYVIQGTAASGNDSFVAWELDYQSTNGGPWNSIASSQSPVSGGVMASWSTAGLTEGYYMLRLTVENACGVTTTTTRVVFAARDFDTAELRTPQSQAIHGRTLCIDGTAWDSCFDNYRLEVRPSNGSYSPVGAGTFTTPIINDPLGPGGWDTQSVADGSYDLRLIGTDSCGNTSSVVRAFEVDNTAPTAVITSPQSCDRLEGLVPIIGTATDANLESWTLQYTGGSNHGWVTIASGNGPITNGALGSWDTSSLENCGYTLRLVVFDGSLLDCDDFQRSSYMTSVEVGECVIQIAATPGP